MAIYRGTGTSGTTSDTALVTEVAQDASEAAQSATQAASSASSAASSAASASTSATNAATSASSANTSATSATSSKNAAAASATQAAGYAVNAATSETNALASKNAAATSETNAATSETNAANSETAASASETAAASSASASATSATAAAGSATSASSSATSAASSATTATTKASEASTSATNAATSATNASTSETNAATSASQAATSATNASTSETNAAASESAAAASASSASTSATAAANSASAASTSATEASTSASNAATSATNASASETAAASSASSANAAKDAALAALDSFDDRYLGTKASDPTLDNDGNALVSGALYFNTTDGVMKVYGGTQWLAAYADLSGALIANNNLSDLTNVVTARTNLGLGTAATTASTDYATAAQGALADSALQSIPDNYILNTGDSITGNLSFGDNNKAIFGAGSDLQIYHDGSHSYVTDAGTGRLYVRASDGIKFDNPDSSKTGLSVFPDSAVYAYYNNALKLATTATGIDVTGTATMDGLTVDGEVDVNSGDISLSAGKALKYSATSYITPENNVSGAEVSTAGSFNVKTGSTPLNRLKIDGTTGDISFYEDTGTTAKFFWDASAESLGIGTSSPAAPFHLETGNNALMARLNSSDANGGYIHFGSTGGGQGYLGTSYHLISGGPTDDYFAVRAENGLDFAIGGSRAMRIDSSGNLLVGTTSGAPSSLNGTGAHIYPSGQAQFSQDGTTALDINRKTSDGDIAVFRKDGTTVGSIGTSGGKLYVDLGNWTVSEDASGNLLFATSGTNKMKLDASGNLTVTGDINANGTI